MGLFDWLPWNKRQPTVDDDIQRHLEATRSAEALRVDNSRPNATVTPTKNRQPSQAKIAQPSRTVNLPKLSISDMDLRSKSAPSAAQQRQRQIGEAYKAGKINLQQFQDAIRGATFDPRADVIMAGDIGLKGINLGGPNDRLGGPGILEKLGEDFINSPLTMYRGGGRIMRGDVVGGAGELTKGVLDSPLGYLSGGKVIQGLIKGGGLGRRVVRGGLQGGALTGAYTAADTASQGGNYGDIAESYGKGFGLGAATGGGLALGAAGLRKLISAKTAQEVSQVLPQVSSESAEIIAKTENPELIKAVLEVDSGLNVSDVARQRLQDEGVRSVRKGETPYGAEYSDGNITLRDDSFSRDDVIFHELGHHIWSNKLTPAEKDAFKNIGGPARKQAEKEGRLGELESEDFSEFIKLALRGEISKVPKGVRSIVAKYAKVMEQNAAATGVSKQQLVASASVKSSQASGALPPSATSQITSAPQSDYIPGSELAKVIQDLPPGPVRTEIDEIAKELGFADASDMTAKLQAQGAPGDITKAVPEEELQPSLVDTSADISQRVYDELPNGIKKKLDRDLPITEQEMAIIAKKTNELGETANQLSLAVTEDPPRRTLKIAVGAANRLMKSGNQKALVRGENIIDKGFYDTIKELAKSKPGRTARMIADASGRSPKEIRGIIYNINGVRRTNPQAADQLESYIYEPMVELDARADEFIRGQVRRLNAVGNQFGKPAGKDRDLLRDALDGQLGPLSDAAAIIDKHAKNPAAVRAYLGEMRAVYEDTLKAVNEQRIPAGLEPVKHRDDYFPHMKEMLNDNSFMRPLQSAEPDYIRRLGSSFGFAKERTGQMKKIEKDPFKVMQIYLLAAERQMASVVPSARIRNTIEAFESIGAKSGQDVASWTKWLEKINKDVTGGNSVDNLFTRLQGRFAGGSIILNAGSTLKNYIIATAQIGITRQHALSSMYHTSMSAMRAIKNKNMDDFLRVDGISSKYLRSSYSAMDLNSVADKNLREQIGDKFSLTFYTTQLHGQHFLLDSLYRKNLASGLGREEAFRIAERQAETMIPTRVPGTVAPIIRGGTLSRMAGLFQTEVIANLESMVDVARPGGALSKSKADALANIAGMALMGNLFNEGYEELFPGQRPAPDPVGWTIKAIDKGVDAHSWAAGMASFGGSAMGVLPFVGSYFSGVSSSPLNVPLVDVAGRLKGEVEEGSGINLNSVARNLSAFAGRGGKAIYRAGEGALRFAQGGVPVGDDSIQLDKNPADLVRMLIGGAYNTKKADQFFDKNQDKVAEPGSIDAIVEQAAENDITFEDFLNGFDEPVKDVVLNKNGKVRSNKELDAIVKERPEFKDTVEMFKRQRDAFNHLDNDPRVADGVGEASTGLLKLFGVDNQDGRLTPEGKERLLKGAPRPEAVEITNMLQQDIFSKLPADLKFQLKPSNGLGLEYAKFENKLKKDGIIDAQGKPIDVVGYHEAKQGLIKGLMGQHFGEPVRQVFGLNQSEIKGFLKDGNITKEALKAALYMDDLEVMLGAKSELKFSKKFRSELGYGSIADQKGLLDKGGGGGSGRGGRSGRRSINVQEMSNYVKGIGISSAEQPPKLRYRQPASNVPKSQPQQGRVNIKGLTLPSKKPTFNSSSSN